MSLGKPTYYAIDFGTSNSLLAAASKDDVFAAAPLDASASDPSVLRSILYFPGGKLCYFGQEALTKYSESGLEGRFLRSIKRHLPSRDDRRDLDTGGVGGRPIRGPPGIRRHPLNSGRGDW